MKIFQRKTKRDELMANEEEPAGRSNTADVNHLDGSFSIQVNEDQGIESKKSGEIISNEKQSEGSSDTREINSDVSEIQFNKDQEGNEDQEDLRKEELISDKEHPNETNDTTNVNTFEGISPGHVSEDDQDDKNTNRKYTDNNVSHTIVEIVNETQNNLKHRPIRDERNVNNTSSSEKKYEHVAYPRSEKNLKEMDIEADAGHDFYRDNDIIQCDNISESPYRFFLMFSGLISSPLAPAHSIRYFLQKVLILFFIMFFLLLKFGALFDLNVMILEKKFPFTIINNIVWELRWIVTYILTKLFMSQNGLEDFLKELRITRIKWRQNAKLMRWYTAFVLIITVILPCVFVVCDLNVLSVGKIKASPTSMTYNVIYTVFVFLYRMIVVPCFCLLSVFFV